MSLFRFLLISLVFVGCRSSGSSESNAKVYFECTTPSGDSIKKSFADIKSYCAWWMQKKDSCDQRVDSVVKSAEAINCDQVLSN